MRILIIDVYILRYLPIRWHLYAVATVVTACRNICQHVSYPIDGDIEERNGQFPVVKNDNATVPLELTYLFNNLINSPLSGEEDCSRQDALHELACHAFIKALHSFLADDSQDAVQSGLVALGTRGTGLKTRFHDTVQKARTSMLCNSFMETLTHTYKDMWTQLQLHCKLH